MSTAYCLTCNEQVLETAGGTCPLGHPVAAHDAGPEPWVGFAGATTDTADLPATSWVEPDMAELQALASVAPAARSNGNGNGNGNGHHGDGAGTGRTHHAAPPVDRAPADSAASDDLAALLAEALAESGLGDDEGPDLPTDHAPHDVPAPTDEPATDRDEALGDDRAVDEAVAPAPDVDEEPDGAWGDLASLAAELQLDDVDDGPGTAAGDPLGVADATDAVAPVEPAHGLDDVEASVPSVADLLAELGMDEVDVVASDPTPDTPVVPPPPAAPPAPEAVAPPPPPPAPEAAFPPAPVHDVPSADEPLDPSAWQVEDEPSWPDHDLGATDLPDEPEAPAPSVDLSNFTARGARVGTAGEVAPRKRRWKR